MVDEKERLEHLGDAEVEAVVELGRKKMKLSEVEGIEVRDVITLEQLAGEGYAVSINGVRFAEGEIVIHPERMACRLTRLRDPAA